MTEEIAQTLQDYENQDDVPPINRIVNYTDQVLAYLASQERNGGEDEPVPFPEIPELSVEVVARRILEQLMADVNNITGFKEAYEFKKKQHNQYELFEMCDIVKDFFIDAKMMEKLCFRETLIISKLKKSGPPEPVGGLCLDIQSASGGKWEKEKQFPDFTRALYEACQEIKENFEVATEEKVRAELEEYEKFLSDEMKREYNKFLVHLSSQFQFGEQNGGSRITAWIDRNFHTLEEKRREYLGPENSYIKEKECYVGIARKHYEIRTLDNEARLCRKYCYGFHRAGRFIGEAATFILMRYLTLIKYIGTFEMSTIHMDGDLCRNIYECQGPIGGFINDDRMDLCKIYRTIIERCGIEHKCCTLLSLDGRIMKQDWEMCDYVLQINPLWTPKIHKPTLVIRLNEAWKYDLQLLSKFLDYKTTSTFKMKSYLKDHQEIVSLINDYVQNILQIKPDNIVEFTKQYFTSYAPYLLPRMKYFEKEDSNHSPAGFE